MQLKYDHELDLEAAWGRQAWGEARMGSVSHSLGMPQFLYHAEYTLPFNSDSRLVFLLLYSGFGRTGSIASI